MRQVSLRKRKLKISITEEQQQDINIVKSETVTTQRLESARVNSVASHVDAVNFSVMTTGVNSALAA